MTIPAAFGGASFLANVRLFGRNVTLADDSTIRAIVTEGQRLGDAIDDNMDKRLFRLYAVDAGTLAEGQRVTIGTASYFVRSRRDLVEHGGVEFELEPVHTLS